MKETVPLLVLRALACVVGLRLAPSPQTLTQTLCFFRGIPAALTIPSALTLLVRLFPGESERARAIGVFSGSGALGNGELFARIPAPLRDKPDSPFKPQYLA